MLPHPFSNEHTILGHLVNKIFVILRLITKFTKILLSWKFGASSIITAGHQPASTGYHGDSYHLASNYYAIIWAHDLSALLVVWYLCGCYIVDTYIGMLPKIAQSADYKKILILRCRERPPPRVTNFKIQGEMVLLYSPGVTYATPGLEERHEQHSYMLPAR